MVVVAWGLGAQKVKEGSFSVPSAPSPSYSEADEILVRLESSAIFSGWHPTLPVHGAGVLDKILLFNGLDRPKKYGTNGARDAFTLAPVRAPTVTVTNPISTPSDLETPYGIAVEGEYMYVCDAYNDRVLQLRLSDMTYLDEITEASGPSDLLKRPQAVCSDGTYLYVTTVEDPTNHRVVKYKLSDLSYQAKEGSKGSGTDQFSSPLGIATDGTYLYVADAGNDRIVKLSNSSLTWSGTYGTTGSGSGQFASPEAIAVDENTSYLWIADTSNNRVVVTDHLIGSGTFFDTFGSGGSGDGNFSYPNGIAVDGEFVYVGDWANHRLVKLAMTDSIIPEWVDAFGSQGDGTDQYQWDLILAYHEDYLYVGQGSPNKPEAGTIRKVYTYNLHEAARAGPSIPAYSYGTLVHAYSYVDDDALESDRSPETTTTLGLDGKVTVGGFHSMDPKVSKIRIYQSYLDEPDVYLAKEITNSPSGTTFSESLDLSNDDLGDLPPLTDKRAGANGLPPICRVAAIWRDRLWMGGRIPAPDYSVGTADFASDWSTVHGLWLVQGTGTHWTKKMIGRTIVETSDEDKTGFIAHVDEDLQYLYLCTEWEGTTGSAISYRIEDRRDDSTAFYSIPGEYEDMPAANFLPCDRGDGDDLVAFYPKGEALYVFKRNSIGLITGTDEDTFAYRRIASGVGVQSPSSVMEFTVPGRGTILAFWSYPTIYQVAGAEGEPTPFSTFVDPLLADASQGASARCTVLRSESDRITWFSLPADDDLANHDTYAFEDLSRSWCRETGPRMSAAGIYRDRNGRRIPLYIDDFGVIWQPGVGDAEGAYDGDLVASVTSYDAQTLEITCNSATFSDDLVGVPVFLVRDDGTYERNIVVGTGLHTLTLAWEPSQAPDSTFQVYVAGIEYLFETGQVSPGPTEILQKYENLWLDHKETAAELLLSAANDEENLSLLEGLDFSQQSPAAIGLSGARWSFSGHSIRLRLSTLIPGAQWTLRGYTLATSWREEVVGR